MLSLNFIGPICSTGYGIASYNLALSLIAKGVDLSIFPIGHVENMPRLNELAPYIVKHSQKHVDKKAPCLKIWHQNDLFEFVGKGRHIGFPIFELDQFTQAEKHSLNHCDELIVCSRWAGEILRNNGINKPTKVVPLGFDPEIFKPASMLGGPTRFFNAGKWEIRKAHDFILHCFEKAFNSKDNVQLIMMCDNPFLEGNGAEWANKYKSSSLKSKITLVPRQATQENVYYIMKQVDCGIFPARAEGWNLELLELMTCGKHLITTDYAGHTEFCTKESCRLIDVTSLESANDGVWFNGFGNWAHLGPEQEEQTINYMREVHKEKQSGQLAQNVAGIFQASQFTWNNSTTKLIEAITNERIQDPARTTGGIQ
jgi:glycosyltransferase involved in cell wall biosynthesis